MVEFIKMTCRKNVNRRIRPEQKLLKVEALFVWLCLVISASVAYKGYHSQIDKALKLFWEKEAAVNEVFYSRFKCSHH